MERIGNKNSERGVLPCPVTGRLKAQEFSKYQVLVIILELYQLSMAQYSFILCVFQFKQSFIKSYVYINHVYCTMRQSSKDTESKPCIYSLYQKKPSQTLDQASQKLSVNTTKSPFKQAYYLSKQIIMKQLKKTFYNYGDLQKGTLKSSIRSNS